MTTNPTSIRLDDETKAIIERKAKAWGMGNAPLIRLAVRILPETPQDPRPNQGTDAAYREGDDG